MSYYVYVGTLPQALHEQHNIYGKEIRVAPDEISITDSRAWKEVYTAKQEFPKDPRKIQYPPNGSHSILTGPREEHARFRRLLSHAFSDKGLREQEPRIKQYVDLRVNRLSEQADGTTSVDIVDWYTCAVFDVIGELAWGESFQGLEERRVHEWIPAILGNLKYITQSVICREYGLSRLIPFFTDPALLEGRKKNFMLASQLTKKRAAYGGEPRGDFWDQVLIKSEGDNASGEGMSIAEMTNNAGVLVLGGAETSATTLRAATYLLLKHPDVMERLLEENRTTFKTDDEINVYSVARLPYMLAVIDETMRIFPAVPDQLQRIPPASGGIVLGKWIPENTAIHLCQYAMNHDSTNFTYPHEFCPERWLPDAPEEFAHDDKQAFQPFVIGSWNCIGSNLAYAEMRLMLASVLFNFDIELDAERTGDWLDQKNYGAWFKKPLHVKLSTVQRT
ncbi:Putative cytochrome P450 [Septoria linicola]|uniref:Cytochrome P450 n=1 Tax=Septoria linicola TaxID=215465 RepID=A0A9Q9ALY4_9PEZI|nr:Putative cytochrome P450 [Septoria linicola]